MVLLDEVSDLLAEDDAAFAAAYRGDSSRPQPVHTCYVPADRVEASTPRAWGDVALQVLAEAAPDAAALALLTGVGVEAADEVRPRVAAKLRGRPVEDLRVDFEDGYGLRPDDVEDADADAAGRALAAWREDPAGPFVAGVRVKGLQPETRERGLRTLGVVVASAVAAGGLPDRFVVTWPKVTSAAQVRAAALVAARLEAEHGLPDGTVRLELQVEMPQAVLGADGGATVAVMLQAGAGRVEGLHYGTYDFSAALGVGPLDQSLDHPLADHAKAVMQLAAAGTGVRVSDGSTNVLPVGDADQVADALRLHARLVARAQARALRQGWDLHPGQLVTRYAATFLALRAELDAAAARLRAYTARADDVDAPQVLDEPATAQALAAAVLRGVDCGAVDLAEAVDATGCTPGQLVRLARRTTTGGAG
ncbi:DUF6986 family protein [Aquipuribacter sp. MA13-6]|uniref:DUF6986 family protein n=1 Tax=unclassified Aquipuribacter TaxID=2635084 RepID=UPI003EED62F9